METGAVLAVTLQDANAGDTTTIQQTLIAVAEQMEKLTENDELPDRLPKTGWRNWSPTRVTTATKRWSISRNSKFAAISRNRNGADETGPGQDNRTRCRLCQSPADSRRARQKLITSSWDSCWERPFAHCYETGRMRRVHLRGRENILKRLLIHIAGFNLSLVLRLMTGNGTPRGLQDLAVAYILTLIALLKQIWQELEAGDVFISAHEC